MRARIHWVAALGLATAFSAAPARADLIVFAGDLDASQVVGTPSTSTATGFAQVTIDTDLFTITTDLFWAGLTGPADRAHMHDAPFGVSREDPPWNKFFHEVIDDSNPPRTLDCPWSNDFPTCVPADGGIENVLQLAGPGDGYGYPDFASLLAVFEAGDVYIDMHTELYPGGEIRGQLYPVAPVPEPSTLALLGLGLSSVASWRKRRS
jgi:hypothetical protein